MELLAYKAYKSPDMDISFWRTANRQEVDFILGDMEVAIEIKNGKRVHEGDLRYLGVLAADSGLNPKRIVICDEAQQRSTEDPFGQISILPWRIFLTRLWANEIYN